MPEAVRSRSHRQEGRPGWVFRVGGRHEGNLDRAMGQFFLVVENYPDLKANQNFIELQAQLEGSENRITVERQKFNETARAYNTYIRQFPKNILSGIFGFERKAYFETAEGAETAPKVEF